MASSGLVLEESRARPEDNAGRRGKHGMPGDNRAGGNGYAGKFLRYPGGFWLVRLYDAVERKHPERERKKAGAADNAASPDCVRINPRGDYGVDGNGMASILNVRKLNPRRKSRCSWT